MKEKKKQKGKKKKFGESSTTYKIKHVVLR